LQLHRFAVNIADDDNTTIYKARWCSESGHCKGA